LTNCGGHAALLASGVFWGKAKVLGEAKTKAILSAGSSGNIKQ
jgi:hypothetical protein